MAKTDVELVSVTVKVNGKKIVVPKEHISFHGWAEECDCCGSHGGAEMTVYIDKESHTVELESY